MLNQIRPISRSVDARSCREVVKPGTSRFVSGASMAGFGEYVLSIVLIGKMGRAAMAALFPIQSVYILGQQVRSCAEIVMNQNIHVLCEVQARLALMSLFQE